MIRKNSSAYDIETVCGRTVEKNKYEANAPETRNWWNQLFGKLEFDAAIPVEKRLEVLEQVFPDRIVDRIVSILGVEDKKYKEPLEKIKDDVGEALRKRVGSLSSLLPDSEKSICDDTDIKECAAAVMTASSSTTTRRNGGEKNESLHEFFKRRPGREAIWRPLPPLSLEEMNLNQKAAYITEAIARDFVEWIKTLGGDEESYLTVQGVVEMFEIGYPVNAATSLRVELKQMPSVPQQVADSTMVPELANRTRLHQEIRRDKRASKKTPHIVAFGRRLPADMQLKPPNKNAFKDWLHCDVPEKIESMAEVWQGITHLKSTKAFCEYLYFQRPDIEPPPYLTKIGMMDMDQMSKRKDSQDADNFGNVMHLTNVM